MSKSIITIREPFWSAWQKYNWKKGVEGIGIKSPLFRGEDNLEIKIGKDRRVWTIPKSEARDIVRKYNSFFWAGNTKLAVLPKSVLKIKKYEKKV